MKTPYIASTAIALFACLSSSSNLIAADYTPQGGVWGYWTGGTPYNSSTEYASMWTDGTNTLTTPTYDDTFTASVDWFQSHLLGKNLTDGTFYADSINITARFEIKIYTANDNIYPYNISSQWVAPSLKVKGDASFKWNGYNASGGNAAVSFGSAISYAGFDQIQIGGNLDISSFANGASFTWNLERTTNSATATKAQYSESLLSLEVGGVLEVGNKQISLNGMGGGSNKLGTYNMHAFVQLGGLDGNGATLSNLDIDGRETTIIFKTSSTDGFKGGSYVGGFTQYWEAAGKMHIIMDSGSANVQSISVTKAGNSIANHKTLAELDVEMRSGALALGNANDADKFPNIELYGGKLSFTDLKQIRTNSFTWNSSEGGYDGGIMSFGVYDATNADTLILENGGTATFAGDNNFAFEIVFYDTDILVEGFSAEYQLISGNVSGLTDDNTTFSFVDSNGNTLSNLEGVYDNATNKFIFTYAAVPEPATIAALLGALALGFAAYRKRK